MNAYFDSAFTDYLNTKIAECINNAEILRADDRSDEANFEIIRKNVYEIFLTVYRTALRTCKDGASAQSFFAQKLDQIPANWVAALEKARIHNDDQRAHTEKLKLEALADIQAAYGRIGREHHD